ncbi:hypothetical protein [Roseateles violae]|uniref:Uncharacterized protein n=1 Tax=Roseateles violae TaxID=3058042 RepID=A0ABT8E0B7_9BURK|nr:hypothetical protein [Pelomonas sp. PFR6]MDN3923262.1 hypothetical protein [Pelomonas sp. PFR6]
MTNISLHALAEEVAQLRHHLLEIPGFLRDPRRGHLLRLLGETQAALQEFPNKVPRLQPAAAAHGLASPREARATELQ